MFTFSVVQDLAKILLTQPVCTQEGEKIALSRRVDKASVLPPCSMLPLPPFCLVVSSPDPTGDVVKGRSPAAGAKVVFYCGPSAARLPIMLR